MLLTKRFDQATAFAIDKHRPQERKGSGAPYVTHLFAVAGLVGEYGGDEEQMIAGLLHDVMEDQGVTSEELSALFGERVARIVVACTDATVIPKPPWRPRKEEHVKKLRSQPADVKLVATADKLHNAASIVRDLANPHVGMTVWTRFSAPRVDSLWYYRAVADALRSEWDHPILRELDDTIARLDLPSY